MADEDSSGLLEQPWFRYLVFAGAAMGGIACGVGALAVFYQQHAAPSAQIDMDTDSGTDDVAPEVAGSEDAGGESETAPAAVDDANPDILALTHSLGYAPPATSSDYADCHDISYCMTAIRSQLVCNFQPYSDCVYSADGMCEISANFVNGRMSSVTFQYDYAISDLDRLKRVLDAKFGFSQTEFKRSEDLGISLWQANWKSGPMRIGLLHDRGVNIKGVPYDKVILSIGDERSPDHLRDR